MIHLGDITKIKGWEIEPVDCVTFGAPCQDLSVAGKRAGMKSSLNGDEETTRSGLFFDAIRVMKEMREHDRANGRTGIMVRCRYGIYENVPGAFSSNEGRDFQAVLTELIRVAEPTAPDVPMPERGGGASQDSSSMKWESGAWPGGLQMRSTTVLRNGEKDYAYWLTSTGLQQGRFCLTLNLSERPKTDNPSRLSEVLEENADPKYRLSPKACMGILNRAERRGKDLPAALKDALERQASMPQEQMKPMTMERAAKIINDLEAYCRLEEEYLKAGAQQDRLLNELDDLEGAKDF